TFFRYRKPYTVNRKPSFITVNGKPLTVNLKLINNIPLARGLGSSAAARIGALVATNRLMGDKLSQDEILKIAAGLEGHPDNVVPALMGGLTIAALKDNEVRFLKYSKVRSDLKVVVAIPDFKISTIEARKILPKNVSLVDYVSSGSNILFTTAILTREGNPELLPELLSESMQDRVHQPYRKKLIPGMEDVFQAARMAGAQGVALSGSGSTIAAFSIGNNEEKNKEIGQAMVAAFQKAGHKSYYRILDIDREGAVCL
ncbi:homoserine kinase, partial [bacterium]|nr:homoserine kinase [bacterium]